MQKGTHVWVERDAVVTGIARHNSGVPRVRPLRWRPYPDGLSAADHDDIWACYRRSVDCDRADFLAGMRVADEACVVRDDDGAALGFGAFRTLDVVSEGRVATVVFVLHAMLAPSIRHHDFVQRAALWRLALLRLRHPWRPIYVMLSASTFISYLMLARNLSVFWPRREHPTPPSVIALVARTVRSLGLEGWDEAAGVLRRHGRLRYREGVVADEPAEPADPDIRFYRDRNPGQGEGDSLLCVFPASYLNAAAVTFSVLCHALGHKATGGPPG